ncbi:MAG: leucine-rich repeat domain-containing protein [Flavobacteriales bacterium]|nr:leucine-rich repeat domain-containing protein [Flavobacteriales bacterium]
MRTIIALLLICFATGVQAQRFSIAELEDLTLFTSLEEALANPDSVYRLRLKVKDTIPPEVFTAFPNLHELNVGRNRLKALPKEIGQLRRLIRFIAERNRLETLPSEIGGMTSLQELILNRNELTGLPKEIGDLTSLYLLDLWSNNIDELPESMKKMTNLKELDLRVIVMSDERKEEIRNMLPDVKVHLDKGCNCGN